MYFKKLLSLKMLNIYPEDTINKIDKYFASLTREARNTIDPSDISTSLGVNYSITDEIIQKCVNEKLLEKQFAIYCPRCESLLKIIPKEDVYNYLKNRIQCDYCKADSIDISECDIFPIYKLLDKPDISSSEKAEEKSYDIKKKLGTKLDEESIYDLFFSPSIEELDELLNLYKNASKNTFKNTIEQGDTLNDLCIYLLNLVKVFHADKTIKKHDNTNQIDCVVHNEIQIKASVFDEMGTIFYCECKNENEKPDNTYYHKLISILDLSRYKLGIIFSRLPAKNTCHIIAKDKFLKDDTVVINITLDEIKPVIVGQYNFLKLIAKKIFLVKSDATSSGVLFD